MRPAKLSPDTFLKVVVVCSVVVAHSGHAMLSTSLRLLAILCCGVYSFRIHNQMRLKTGECTASVIYFIDSLAKIKDKLSS